MAEIKSTLELVMEKVGNIKITPEDRKKFKREEIEARAQRLFNRYFIQGDQKDLSALKKELKGAQEEVKEILNELLISSYSFETPSRTMLQGLESLQGKRGDETIKALRELTSSYQGEREEQLQKMGEELREALASRGISGTAVEPNPIANPRWTDFIDQLNRKYEDKKRDLINKRS
jgi:hypothetical protein